VVQDYTADQVRLEPVEDDSGKNPSPEDLSSSVYLQAIPEEDVPAPIRIPGIKPKIHNTNKIENVSLQPAQFLSDTDLNWLEQNTKWQEGQPVSNPRLEQHQAPDEDALTLKKFLFGHHPYESWVERLPKELFNQTVNAVKGVHGIMNGQIEASSPEGIKSVFDFATLMVGGVPGVKTEGSLGSFAGVGARTANLDKLEVAKLLEKAGTAPEAIAAETGWMKDIKDNFWKYRINDSTAKLNESVFKKQGTDVNSWYTLPMKETKLKDLYDHPELYKAYPDLGDTSVRPLIFSLGTKGTANFEGTEIRLAGSESLKDIQSTLSHEVQHIIQTKEGFATGGTSSMFTPKNLSLLENVINKSNKELDERIKVIFDNSPLKENKDFFNPYWLAHNVTNLEKNLYVSSTVKDKLIYLKENSPETYEALKLFDQAYNLTKKTRDAAYEHYTRIAGEIEARQVQRELNKSPEELKGILPDTGVNGKDSILVRIPTISKEQSTPSKRLLGNADYPHMQKGFMDAIAKGYTTRQQIAGELQISPGQVSSLADKMGVDLAVLNKATPWSAERLSTAKRMIEEGKSFNEIAKEFGISSSAASSKLRALGYESPYSVTRRERWNDAGVARLKELAEQGLPSKDIGEVFGVDRSTILNKAKELGIDIKPSTAKRDYSSKKEVPIATADFPHSQESFKKALAEGATTRREIADVMQISENLVTEVAKKVGYTFPGTKVGIEWTVDKDRKLLKLINDGLSYSEVGAILGLTRGQVAGRHSRIK
jgi:DNA-binding CsgD family transcriptional regulator